MQSRWQDVVKHTFFAGRTSTQRADEARADRHSEPQPLTKGALQIVDAFYDTRYKFNNTDRDVFRSRVFRARFPSASRTCPKSRLGAVYGSGDGSLTLVNYRQGNIRAAP